MKEHKKTFKNKSTCKKNPGPPYTLKIYIQTKFKYFHDNDKNQPQPGFY